MTLPTRTIRSAGDAFAQRGSRSASALGVNNRSESRSVSTRLISSGIVRSQLRSPASTCATRTPSLPATSAQARVELTSPTTTTQSGCSRDHYALERQHDPRRLLGVRPAADAEVDVRFGHSQIAEERLRHRVVVMLPGVNEDLRDLAAASVISAMIGADLHEVGARAHHV